MFILSQVSVRVSTRVGTSIRVGISVRVLVSIKVSNHRYSCIRKHVLISHVL